MEGPPDQRPFFVLLRRPMEVRMARNRGRFDPYKGFNFQVAIGGAIAAVAGLALVKLLVSAVRSSKREPKDYLPADSGARPIEAVGTSTARFVGEAPRKPASRGRKGSARGKKGAAEQS
jgi:hypothetical protein